MNVMFQKSTEMWKQVASCMHAHYHLWGASELESLMKQKYPQFWDMYQNVRYPVMRVDIGRIVVLHAFGGIYADCDIFPNRSFYEQVQLAVQRVPEPKKENQKLPPTKKGCGSQPRTNGNYFLDMEVIVAAQGNPILIEFLDFMIQEIRNKPYAIKGRFWYTARMRYIWHTTGPRAMNRFFKQPEIAKKLKGLKFVECNFFRNTEMSQNEKQCLDVISNTSNSYFTDEHEIHVPVGAGDGQIPLVGNPRRMNGKRSARAFVIHRQVGHSQDVTVPIADAAPSPQGGSPSANLHAEGEGCDGDGLARAGCVLIPVSELVDRRNDRDRLIELRAWFAANMNSVSTQCVLNDMLPRLREWVTEGHQFRRDLISSPAPTPKRTKLNLG